LVCTLFLFFPPRQASACLVFLDLPSAPILFFFVDRVTSCFFRAVGTCNFLITCDWAIPSFNHGHRPLAGSRWNPYFHLSKEWSIPVGFPLSQFSPLAFFCPEVSQFTVTYTALKTLPKLEGTCLPLVHFVIFLKAHVEVFFPIPCFSARSGVVHAEHSLISDFCECLSGRIIATPFYTVKTPLARRPRF